MEDRSKEIYKALAEVSVRQKHGEACRNAIRKRADAWLGNTVRASKRLDFDNEAEALDPRYNDVGKLNMARGADMLRKLRDGD